MTTSGCSFPRCTKKHHARGLCVTHYGQWLKEERPRETPPLVIRVGCVVANCDKKHYGQGFCAMHYRRWKRWGDPLRMWEPERDAESDPRNMSGEARAEFGAIVSFENSAGERLTLHRFGLVREAVRGMCAEALAIDPTYRVRSVSTPATIYGDLQGSRGIRRGRRSGSHTVEFPEHSLVPTAMRHPSLLQDNAA